MMADLTDPRHVRYLDWLTTAPHLREPSTQSAIAAELDVAPRTLRDWQTRPEFRKAWEKQAYEISGSPEKTQMLLDALFVEGLDRDSPKQVAAVNAWAKMTGNIKPSKVEDAQHTGPLIDLTAEQLDEMLRELLEKAQGASVSA